MTESETWTARCQDTTDGSGDFIVDFPPDLLAAMGWGLGDVLTVEVIDGSIVLKPETYTPPST
ncbi:AbrB/MazE/SpoVT family DNA-binding domain-containing protein [Pseudomonas bubulae]|uniref:AbrB/MazE/SpoVT family DNA-binding domain-containing protein n=1 Tax=Pseudomonas bubulae TaxID=2316085 RepID=UPI0039A212B6